MIGRNVGLVSAFVLVGSLAWTAAAPAVPPLRPRSIALKTALPFRVTGDVKGIRSWRIEVLDPAGRAVSAVFGLDAPPAGPLPWLGVSTDGRLLQDGEYRARLEWLDLDGIIHEGSSKPFLLRSDLRAGR